MELICVDESGSMTVDNSNNFPFFVICSVRIKNEHALKRRYKRFVSKNYKRLKELDEQYRIKNGNPEGKMFNENKFCELKGCCFDYEMKKKFVNYFCKPDYLEIFYIKVSNKKITRKLYKDKAIAFNYFYKIMMDYLLDKKILPKDYYHIKFDNRNIKSDAKLSLPDYLKAELSLHLDLVDDIDVDYHDSCNCEFIQLADVFSNIFYSSCFHISKYNYLITRLKKTECLKVIYKFPL